MALSDTSLQVDRQWETAQSTCGIISIEGVFECYSLEPPADKRIPAGTYIAKKEKTFAPHIVATLERLGLPLVTPHFKGIPGWDDNGPHGPVEIHPGNKPDQTEGCTLVGKTHTVDFVGNSDLAFVALMEKLPNQFTVTYTDPPIVSDTEIGM